MRHSADRFFPSNLIEYIREFKSICKTVLAHESGDPEVQFNEKTEGRKSRETVPLVWNLGVIDWRNKPSRDWWLSSVIQATGRQEHGMV
jgi:hypothetical protein